jgi:hypothetical protein
MGREHYARHELFMKGPEADREFGEFDIRAHMAADARRRAPGQEFGIARNVSDELEKLAGSEAHDAPLGMTRNHAAISP